MMKEAKRILAFIMIVLLAFSATTVISAEEVPMTTSLELNATSIKWVEGKSGYFKPTILPEGASKALEWESTDESVATVSSSGKLTAVSAGRAIIFCRTTDGSNLSKSCTVVVTSATPLATSLKLNATKINWNVGKSGSFKPTITPSNASNKLEWISTDPKVATISQTGKLTAVSKGTTIIFCRTTDGSNLSVTCTVTVTQPKATSLKLNCKTINWPAGKSGSFKATVTPSNASKTLSWTSSNTKVATVTSAGKLTAISKGTATITCKTTDGSNLKATCKVTVTQSKTTSLKLNTTKINWKVGTSGHFLPTVTPSNASRYFSWTSSNTKVATVSSAGKLTAVGVGTAIITCKTTDGSNLSATCAVTVYEATTTKKQDSKTTTQKTLQIPSSKADIVNAYKNAANKTKAQDNMNVEKTCKVTINIDKLGGTALTSIANSVANKFMNQASGAPEYETFKNGKPTKNTEMKNGKYINDKDIYIPLYGKKELCTLDPQNVKSAAVTKKTSNSYDVKIVLKDDVSDINGIPAITSTGMDYFNPKLYTDQLEGLSFTSGTVHYTECVITATVNADGYIDNVKHDMKLKTDDTVVKFLGADFDAALSGRYVTTFKFYI